MTEPVDLSDAKRLLLQCMLSGEGPVDAAGGRQIALRPAGAPVPLTPEQRHVWLHAAMVANPTLYNEPFTIRRIGPCDPAALERSINELVRRHELWRTSFGMEDGEVRQIVHPALAVSLPVTDLSGLPDAEREAAAVRLAAEDARLPFDVERLPLFRMRLVKLHDDDHRLCATFHHLVFDGVSVQEVILPQLSALYEDYAAGREPTLAAPALQYGDYAVWRGAATDERLMQPQIEQWRLALCEVPALQLPSDRPRPPTPSHRGAMAEMALSSALTAELRALGRDRGVTLHTTLLAAFTALLHRYTGQSDFAVGGVVDTRRKPELEGVPGYFLNSVAYRTRPAADLPFEHHLAAVQGVVADALSAIDVPFDQVLRALHMRRDPTRHPVFQVMFVLEPPRKPFPPGWEMSQSDVPAESAKFELYVDLEERGDSVKGRFLYSTDLFEHDTIVRMIGHFVTLLEGVARDPHCALGALPLLPPAERRRLLETWNRTARPPATDTLVQWFEQQARTHPEATAVTWEGRSWTYRALAARAAALAAGLRRAGVGRETLVGICMARSPEMVAGLLAIMAAGGAYLPLDPAFPQARLALILDDARPAIVLTERGLAASLPPSAARHLFCDDLAAAGRSAAPAPVPAGPDDLAYVLYTSGSTGKPKGVEITHRALANLLRAMQRAPGFGSGDSLLAVTTLSFDIAALELFLPLASGGRIVLASHDSALDPRRLAALIESCGCTVMQATPATWRGLIEADWRGSPDLTILCGGEALPRDLADALLKRCGALWNMYGPTETTIWSTVHPVLSGTGPVPIGRPIDNTSLYVLNGDGLPAPIGVPGELYIGGVGLARGYRNRADLTQERFTTKAAAPGVRLYRTGDLARYRSDGVLECLGRTDNQVKVRGFRVELEEIEGALAGHPDLAAAAVKAWPDPSGEARLVAYVVARGAAPTAAELRRFLGGVLPDYMTPSLFTPMPRLPMTPNRKVDRNALPKPQAWEPERDYVAPRDAVELRLAALWQEVLGVAQIGVYDNFFDLGGHSLLVAKLLRRVEAEFGRRLPMAVVFHAPDVERMAALLAEPAAAGGIAGIIPLQARGTLRPLLWCDPRPEFRPLGEALGRDQPLLGVALDAVEIADLGETFEIADVARCLARTMRAYQPTGPYLIGGYCTWGVIAYEVAQQLIAAGEDVPLVILAHAPNPAAARRTGDLVHELSKVKQHLGRFWRLGARDGLAEAVRRSRRALRRYRDTLARAIRGGRQREFKDFVEAACERYRPARYDGEMLLFQPEERPGIMEYRSGWEPVITGSLRSYEVAGDHVSMLEPPNVESMAAQISATLQRTQAPVRATVG